MDLVRSIRDLGLRPPSAMRYPEPTMTIERILVPTDFSPASLQALDYAVALARSLEARLTLLFVHEPVGLTTTGDRYIRPAKLRSAVRRMEHMEQRHLARLQRNLKKKRVSADTIFAHGNAAQTIADTAAACAADVIVMATHGRSGLSRFFVGSVAEKVLRLAPCPVITIRRPN